jgi:hypothetical protein
MCFGLNFLNCVSLPCPVGSLCNGFGRTNYSACPQGYYCASGTLAPTACPAGTFSNQFSIGSVASCQSCLRGYYCETSGLTHPSGLWFVQIRMFASHVILLESFDFDDLESVFLSVSLDFSVMLVLQALLRLIRNVLLDITAVLVLSLQRLAALVHSIRIQDQRI